MGFPTEYHMLIDGELVKGEAAFDVLNPATGKAFTQVPDCTEAHVDAAVAAAKKAFPAWAAKKIEDRKDCVAKMLAIIDEHKEKLSELICLEQGKPKGGETPERAAMGASGEMLMVLGLIQQKLATLELPEHVWRDEDDYRVSIVRRPLGVVAGIAPWNFPLLTLLQKMVAAVIFGNTFVAKPSPFTPVATLAMFELIKDCFPAGVVNVVVSDDARFRSGAHLTSHPDIAKVSFTGSVPTGKAIMKSCANDVKRVTLELGGNDAAIVCGDVDVAKAAVGVFRGAFANTGQVCIAIKRCFVHASIFDKFVEEMVKLAQAAKVGDGMNAETMYGPLNNAIQLRIVSDFVEDARKNGATVHCGGKKREGDGFFYEPTIITNVKEGVRIVDEEQFGPALPIIKFEDEEDALVRANSTNFGLGGSVWAKDIEKANGLAARMLAGTVWVNEHLGATGGAPFGGMKLSGLGRENGPADLGTWTEMMTLKTAKKTTL
eukprot:TRINITY_DN280_c0_g1_i10.p1 TRINITY_DN280_c0_g1~~TRINITY_DN280_c0_g1_i10.p1  ORF type:complete len:510 (+),score=252.07 TRINITY_DN280_c0_g1_i10:64-1530(+)